MFDGDFNVLLTQIVDSKVDNYVQSEDGTIMRAPGNITVRDLLNSSFQKVVERAAANGDVSISLPQKTPGVSLIDQLTAKYPILQVAVPVLEEQLEDENYIPPVIFLPDDYDEQTTEYVPAIRGDVTFAISAKNDPDSACIVISQNERTDILKDIPVKPKAPSGLIATKTAENGVMLKWEQNESEDVIDYEIFRKSQNSEDFEKIGMLQNSPKTDLVFYDNGISSGNTYDYYVVANSGTYKEQFVTTKDVYKLLKGQILSSDLSNVTNVVTGDDTSTAFALTLKHAEHNSLLLTWKAPNVSPIYAYEVWRKKGNGNYEFIGSPASNTTSFKDVNLDLNTQYRYKVRVAKSQTEYWSEDSKTAITIPSARNNKDKISVSKVKFTSYAALRAVEPWVKGAPELYFLIYSARREDYLDCLFLTQSYLFRPPSRKSIVESWYACNHTIYEKDKFDINEKGTVWRFCWVESDHYEMFGTNEHYIVSSFYENKNEQYSNQTLKSAPVAYITYVPDFDDIISTSGQITDPNNYIVNNSLFKWWNPKSFIHTDQMGFQWIVE